MQTCTNHFGSSCNIVCNTGYQLSGSTVRTCEVAGSLGGNPYWSGTDTICTSEFTLWPDISSFFWTIHIVTLIIPPLDCFCINGEPSLQFTAVTHKPILVFIMIYIVKSPSASPSSPMSSRGSTGQCSAVKLRRQSRKPGCLWKCLFVLLPSRFYSEWTEHSAVPGRWNLEWG